MWLAPIGLWEFALCTLAGHRVWVFYNQEDIFLSLRRFVSRRIHVKLGGRFNPDGTPMFGKDQLGREFVIGPCQHCTAVWIGLIIFAAWFIPYIGPAIVTTLGVVAVMGAWDVVIGAVDRSGFHPQQFVNFSGDNQSRSNLVVAER